jgi:zinc D-Ala-D-Ala carboxypeptidase
MGSCNIITKESLRRPNFSPDEFFVSDTAKRAKIINYPSLKEELIILPSLMSTADMMQSIYDILLKELTNREIKAGRLREGDKIVGFFLKINSAYRCPTLNTLVGSSSRSQHPKGLACDFVCPKFGTPEEIVEFLHSKGFVVDQCFNEGSWVHISRLLHKDAKNRMMYGYYLADETGKRKFKAI